MADAVIQLRDLQSRYAELQAEVSHKDVELQHLREMADAVTALQAQDVQTAKIIDLSKKNRQLQLQLEKERAKTGKLQADLKSKNTAATAPGAVLGPEAVEGIARRMVEQAAEAAEQAHRQADMWKDKCQQNTNKIAQLEQKVFSLEIEAKKLTRALVREVGEDVPLSKVVEEGSSDWKGRREQIIALKYQVQSLKAAQGLGPEPRHEAAAKKVLSKVSGSKAAELDQLRAELASAREEAEAARTKAEGAVSRRKILEAELSGLKDKVSVVLTKTQNDDRLIAALKTELAMLKRSAGDSAGSRPQRPSVEEDDELWRELSALRRRCGEQQAQIERYESTIQTLGERLQTAMASGAGAGGTEGPGGGGGSQGGAAAWNLPQRPSGGMTVMVSTVPRPSSGVGGVSVATAADSSVSSPARTQTPDSARSGVVLGRQSSVREETRSADRASLGRQASARGPTPVEVREGGIEQQLRVAQVENSRLQELVQLLQRRIQELEDELEDSQQG